MSNPAVIRIALSKINLGAVKIEANLGEPYHIHIGDLRLDVTKEQLIELIKQTEIFQEKFLNI